MSVVRSGCHHQRSHAKRIFDGFGHIVAAKVAHRHFGAAFCAQHLGQTLRHRRRAAINRRIGNEHAFGFNRIAAPNVVKSDVIGQIFRQNRTVERTNRCHIERSHLFQEILHLHAILAANVEIVTPRLARPLFVVRQHAKFAKRIGRKEQFFALFVRHYHLGPMHHGSGKKLQRMPPKRERVALFDRQRPPLEIDVAKKLRQHFQCRHRRHNFHIGIECQQVAYHARMVGLEVVHHQIVGAATAKRSLQVGEPHAFHALIDRIHHRNLLIFNKIRIVRDTIRRAVLALEQVDFRIVHANVFHCGGYFCIHFADIF